MLALTILVSSTLLVQLIAGHNVDHANKLEAVHVVFRHGDRTPDSPYPNDPYFNYTYYPVGLGHLTNDGKRREYNIGRNLRHRYGSILGEIYTPGILYAVSSHYPRCKASLELVLAGIFPPKSVQRWNPILNWQPIPYETFTGSNKMFSPHGVCSNLTTYALEYINGKSVEDLYPMYTEYVQYILDHSGLTENGLWGPIMVHSTIKSQEEWGLPLPSWTDPIWPTILTALNVQSWKNGQGSPQANILNAGYLLSTIMNNTYTRINEEEPFKNTNLFLYSGHDSTIGALLGAFDHMGLEYIDYGSQIMLELYNFNGNRYMKILYENYKIGDPRVLVIPGCTEFCPLNQFVAIMSNYLDPELYESLCN